MSGRLGWISGKHKSNLSKIDKDDRKAGILLEGKYAKLDNCVGIGPDAGMIDKGEGDESINCRYEASGHKK